MSKEFNKAVGKKIYILRTMHGYSREELAFLASISVRSLFDFEKGNRGISAEQLSKIAALFNVSCDFLVGLETDTDTIREKADVFGVWK